MNDLVVVVVCIAVSPLILLDKIGFETLEPCNKYECNPKKVMEYHDKRGTKPSPETLERMKYEKD